MAFVQAFSDATEAVRLANDSPFGLAAYVYGPEAAAESVAEQLSAGMIKINGVSMLRCVGDMCWTTT